MKSRCQSPWIWRTTPDWGDNLIDFIMFETRVLAIAANTVSAKISGIRFWHLLVGMPDFTLGGGRYTQVLKGCRRGSRVSRKIPVTLEMLQTALVQDQGSEYLSAGVACAALMGFFFLLRVGEMEGMNWRDVSLFADEDGDACLGIELPKSKTDQYNEGHIKRLKGPNRPLCPVRAMGKWMGIQTRGRSSDENKVSPANLRSILARTLKFAATSLGIDYKRVSNHSLLSGGASCMFAAGSEMEIIKRWGRWISATSHQYLWREEHVLANISKGMLYNKNMLPYPAGQGVQEETAFYPSRSETGGHLESYVTSAQTQTATRDGLIRVGIHRYSPKPTCSVRSGSWQTRSRRDRQGRRGQCETTL